MIDGERLLPVTEQIGATVGDPRPGRQVKQSLLEPHQDMVDLALPLDSFGGRNAAERDRVLLALKREDDAPRIATLLEGCHESLPCQPNTEATRLPFT